MGKNINEIYTSQENQKNSFFSGDGGDIFLGVGQGVLGLFPWEEEGGAKMFSFDFKLSSIRMTVNPHIRQDGSERKQNTLSQPDFDF